MEPIKKGSLGISPGSYYVMKGTYRIRKMARKRKIKKIFTLYSAVNVGLGILNPSAKLHVTLPTRLTRKYSADAESALHYKIKRILSWLFQ